jgi:hypothetical protein
MHLLISFCMLLFFFSVSIIVIVYANVMDSTWDGINVATVPIREGHRACINIQMFSPFPMLSINPTA